MPLSKSLEQGRREGDEAYRRASTTSPVASTRSTIGRARSKRSTNHSNIEGGCQAGGADDAEGGRSDGELRKHREAVQQLSSQAMQTQASLETLKKERAALEISADSFRGAEAE